MRMTSVISGTPVGEILRRSSARSDPTDLTADSIFDPKDGRGIRESDWGSQAQEEPLGLRDSWIKRRTTVRRYAESKKSSMKYRQGIGGNHDHPSGIGLGRIRDKVRQMRDDLGRMLREGDQALIPDDVDKSHLADPPKKGGGSMHGRFV